MDGWHDMGVYLPVQGAGDQFLELNVTGDFRNWTRPRVANVRTWLEFNAEAAHRS